MRFRRRRLRAASRLGSLATFSVFCCQKRDLIPIAPQHFLTVISTSFMTQLLCRASRLAARRYSCSFACLSDGSARHEQKENRPSAPTAVQGGRGHADPPQACRLQIREAGAAPVLHAASEKVCKHRASSRFDGINNSCESFLRPASTPAF